MKVLAIGAHPDDIELNCGGTMLRYKRLGHEVAMLNVCSGDKGHAVIEPERMAQIRKEESKKAAEIIGAEIYSLGYGDGEIENTLKMRNVIIDAIRKVDPDIIITHSTNDYHADHAIVSQVVIDASFMVSVPHIKTEHKAMNKVPQIYFMEPYTGMHFQPQEYVDITDVMDLKIKLMEQHRSQIEWLLEHDNYDILDCIKTIAKFRGMQCGTKYAEGFIRYTTALRAIPGRFLP